MKRRIFLFHTAALIAALLALLLVNGIVVHWTADFYRHQAVPAVNTNSAQVQALLDDWPVDSDDWPLLERSLKEQGFELVVEEKGHVVHSSLDKFQSDLFRRIAAQINWPEGSALVIQNEGMLMVGRRSTGSSVVAVIPPQVPAMFGRQRPQEEAATLSLVFSGMVAIGVIVFLSLLFTRYQVKQILRPVRALTDAAKRVEEGDFSTPVGYNGRDEFYSVCASFDHMQQHLLREREKNALYEQARTDLVAGISHDLRTPLTSVKGYIKGLRDGVANTPEKQKQYLDIAYRKSCDMDRLLQRLFYFSKLETGNLPLICTQTDLGEFVGRFVQELQQELEPAGTQVILKRTPQPCFVSLDAEQMYRVLTNLTENAVRYANVDPLVITLEIERQGELAVLRFTDNGQGIDSSLIPHLFDQFWRGDQARGSRDGEGSGLGLYIVKYIVQAHGGTIQVSSNGGLVFEMTLPCKEVMQLE